MVLKKLGKGGKGSQGGPTAFGMTKGFFTFHLQFGNLILLRRNF
jgi:hypothetical protein